MGRVNGIAAGYILVALITLHNYISFMSVGFLLGTAAAVVVLQDQTVRPRSSRYAWMVFICGLLCCLMPVKTLLYFTICFGLIFFRESFYGKTSVLIPAIVLFASPAFQYMGNTFSFPIRMQLTRAAGYIFNLIGYNVQTQGNLIVFEDSEFSVDPACMGLKMITTSLLLGIILVAYYQLRWKKQVGVILTILYLLIVFACNILGNLFRIFMLVLFNIPPETIAHDTAGIGCLIVYVFIPAVWLASFIVRKYGGVKSENKAFAPIKLVSRRVMLHLLVLLSVALLGWTVRNTDTFRRFNLPSQQQVPGYTFQLHAPGIVKVENDQSLIYIKYIRGFYDTEHNPMLCWSGSGYQFEKVTGEKIGSNTVFTARLTKDNDKLYSAWWFDNGVKRTVDQFEWRTDLLRGGNDYAIVNVTCATKDQLDKEVKRIIDQRTLSAFFNK